MSDIESEVENVEPVAAVDPFPTPKAKKGKGGRKPKVAKVVEPEPTKEVDSEPEPTKEVDSEPEPEQIKKPVKKAPKEPKAPKALKEPKAPKTKKDEDSDADEPVKEKKPRAQKPKVKAGDCEVGFEAQVDGKTFVVNEDKNGTKRWYQKKTKPSRAPTAYNNFVKFAYKDFKERGVDMPQNEMMKEASKLWKALSDEEKLSYKTVEVDA